MKRWKPAVEFDAGIERILKLVKNRKLYGFLRRHRHVSFNDAFQAVSPGMYRATGAGRAPVPPAPTHTALPLPGVSTRPAPAAASRGPGVLVRSAVGLGVVGVVFACLGWVAPQSGAI